PHILRDWLNHTSLLGSKDIYFVMNCGSDIGNSEKYIKKICKAKNMIFKGCAEIVMPENYIAMFDAPKEDEALKIIDEADPVIEKIANQILNNENLDEKKISISDKFKSSIVNAVFYSVFLHSKKFTVSDACISCGKCEKLCVLNNIKLIDGKPKWEDNCTHCMACICNCPIGAIEYGNASKGKPRYHCPK
ncbi:MAG: EFR1 family ferrodoxin, partial [Eubacterium sp.]|nr:EFR1 family ferrodoxin [Eubacterium sp.]